MTPARALLAVMALAACAGPALAGTTEDRAAAAAAQLRAAVADLATTEGASNRIDALTRTIRAYEDGMMAVRAGLRDATRREVALSAELAAERARIAATLGALAALGQAPDAELLLHPAGPVASLRGGLILAAATKGLEAEAQSLRERLAEIAALRATREQAAAVLAEGLAPAQAARTALSQAVQTRTDLPQRFLEDPEELRALLASAESLDAFATALVKMETDIGAPMGDFAGTMGHLPLPVRGTLLRRMNEADAAGIVRPGIVLETPPGALVTAPAPATIRFRGPLLDYENVMIVEPAEGFLLVLAGLETVYGDPGDVVEAGAPLGLMGGNATLVAEFGAGIGEQAQLGGGGGPTETLYMELRQGAEPVDPILWFDGGPDNKGTWSR